MSSSFRESFDSSPPTQQPHSSHHDPNRTQTELHDEHNDDSEGIRGGPQAGPSRRMKAYGMFNDTDPMAPIPLALHGLQTFLPFINTCIFIAIAVFQKYWQVGPSFLTVLSLIIALESLIIGGILLGAPFLFNQLSIARSITRELNQVRIALILNGLQAVLNLLLAFILTISANTGGCKNATNDPNADHPGLIQALPTFCRNKRAGAAFFYLTAIVWIIPLVQTLITARQIRKNPLSTPFEIPFTHSHEPVGGGSGGGGRGGHNDDEEEANDRGNNNQRPREREEDRNDSYATRPSGDYYRNEPFNEPTPAGYEAKDPFNDENARYDTTEQGRGGGGGGGGEEEEEEDRYAARRAELDPYELVRKSMDHR